MENIHNYMKRVLYKKLTNNLYKEWENLWKKSSFANYANSPQWLSAVLESFGYREYIIIGIYDKKVLQAIGSLVRVKKFGMNVYTLPPNDHVCGIPFLIDIQDEKVMKQLHTVLLQLGIVYLDNIPEAFVKKLKKLSKHTRAHTFSMNYFIPLQEGEKGKVRLENRKELLRRVKKEEENFAIKSYSGSKQKGLQRAFSIDAVSRKQTKGYNVFASSKMRDFYTILEKYFKKNMRTNILYYKKEPIAYEIGFITKNKYFGNQLGFAEKFKHFSPGKVISVKLADHLFKKGIQKIDFGSGDSHLKRLITKEKNPLYVIIISKKYASKIYLHHMSIFRTKMFEKIEKNRSMYTAYRMIKNVGKK